MQRESVVWPVPVPAIFAGILLLGLIVWRAWSQGRRGSWAIVRQVIG